MKSLTKGSALLSLAAVMVFASGATYAEYELSAFHVTSGYRSIVAGNAESALRSFEGRNPERLDFWELNNLCVSQIMVRKLNDAITSCESALQELDSERFVGFIQRRKAAALIYSNLGVAKAVSGDLVGANSDLEKSLAFDPGHRNTQANIDQVRTDMASVASGN